MTTVQTLSLLVALAAGAGAPPGVDDVVIAFRTIATRDLWPGFDPMAVPLAIDDGTDTWLIGHPAPPQGFTRSVPDPDRWVYAGHHPEVRANSWALIGGRTVGTLLLRKRETRSAEELAAVMVHETFHVYQNEHYPGWVADEGALMTYPAEDPDLLALRRLETDAFRRALEAGSAGESVAWAKLGIALRRLRFERLPPESAAYEQGVELREGIAQYVQMRALGRLGDTTLPPDGFDADAVRRRCYDTGQALAVLLDRFEPGWKDALAGADALALDDLLAGAVERYDVPAAEFAAQVRQDIEQRAARDALELSVQRAFGRDEFLGRPGWSLRIAVAEGGEALWPAGFDPMNLEPVGDGALLHRRWLKLSNGAGEVEVLDREALTMPAGPHPMHPMFNGVRELVVTGLPERPTIEPQGDGVTIEAAGITARFAPAVVEIRGQECLVTAGGP